jgi:putative transposase
MKKVPASKVVTAIEGPESLLPPRIQEALGELVGAGKEGLLALSVGVGLSVVHELMELEVDEVVGPKGKHNPERAAKRHGHEDGSVTLRRPADEGAPAADPNGRRHPGAAARNLRALADRDPLTRAVMDRMLVGSEGLGVEPDGRAVEGVKRVRRQRS